MILSSNTDTGKFFEQTGYRHKNSQRFYSKWFCSSNLTLLFLYFVVTCNVKTFSFRGQHHFHLSTARSSGILMKSMKSNVAFSRGSSIFLSPLLSSTFSHGSTISTLRTFRGMFRSSSSSEKKRSLERYRDFNIFQAAREADDPANRPFTLPPGEFKPKQSLGQNFLVDQNYVRKIVDSLEVLRPPSSLLFSSDTSDVIEIGPGIGALTKQLFPKYPAMTVVEIDQRAVKFLREKIPMLSIIEDDVLNVDWTELANKRGKKLHVIGNLPYYIVSQVLFALADHNTAISQGVFTMQLEVAERLIAKPNTKAYGIPSVVFQLYSQPSFNFLIPPTVFYPKPKVDSALVTLDFTKQNPKLKNVNPKHLRTVLNTAFNQRRKMMRQSLKDLIKNENLLLPEKWSTLRPEQLQPTQFLELTIDLFGENSTPTADQLDDSTEECIDRASTSIVSTFPIIRGDIVWRRKATEKDKKKVRSSNDDMDRQFENLM